MRYLALILLACGTMAALSGCNTVEGVGRDLEGAGRKIQNL